MAKHRTLRVPKINTSFVGETRPLRKVAATVSLALAAALAGAGLAGPAQADGFIEGRDMSHYESSYDWAGSGAQFGIVKATEGTDIIDSSFARHWAEIGKLPMVRGAYHFGRPSNDPVAEADFFLSVVNKQPAKAGDLLVLDLETTDGQSPARVNAWAKTWLQRVKSKTGVTPLFYANSNFAEKYGQGLGEYPLWVANYNEAKGTVTPPSPWKKWIIHQYTDDPVDQNVSSLHQDQLRALGRR
ncbi:glycoside hydrolase family 25 protein [Nonomuraea sp. M3C6]|uniref:Glycoside hydrolase family 25 protein n=1 Tax=Nonomuraea marmarensis TaxID=3351344 RepID=A0ABW7ASV8_9ACTN